MSFADSKTITMNAIEEIEREVAGINYEITQSKAGLEQAETQYLHQIDPNFTEEELNALNDTKKEEAQLSADTALHYTPTGAMGGSTIILASLIDIFTSASKDKRSNKEEQTETIPNKPGYTNLSSAFLKKASSPKMKMTTRTKKVKKEPSVFAGLKVGEAQRKRNQENQKRRLDLMNAQRRELEHALQKDMLSREAQRTLVARQQAMLEQQQKMAKLEALGFVPKGFYTGPKPPTSYYHRSED